jgi:excisionase family DNA binding protein
MNPPLEQKLSFTIEQAVKATGIGRTAIFAAIKSGRLVARKNGRRTLIAASDLQQFVASLPRVDRNGDNCAYSNSNPSR